MAKRFTDTGKWDKKWFRELKPKYKCFWDYITCKCDMAGIWEVDLEAAVFYIKEDISKDEILEIIKDQIYVINDKKWLIKDFIKFQYSVDKLTQSSPIHRKIIDILNKHGLYDSLRHSLVARVQSTLSPSLFDNGDENESKKIGDYNDNQVVKTKKEEGNIDRLGDRLCNSLQEKEKDKEEEEVKEEGEEGSHELQIFVLENLPHVSKIKKQLNFKEAIKLVELFGIQDVKDVLMRMDNKKGVEKKYNTVYQTCREWCSNNFSSNNNSHTKHPNKKNGSAVDKATAKQIAENEKLSNITPDQRKSGWELE